MAPLLRQLHSFDDTEKSPADGVKRGEIQRLTQDLEGLRKNLHDLPEAQDPSMTARYWMKQVRELCYDTEDYLDGVMHSVDGARRSARFSTIFWIHKRLKRRPHFAMDFSELMARVKDASERYQRFELGLLAEKTSHPKTINVDFAQAGVSYLMPKLSTGTIIPVHGDTGRSIVGVEEPMNKHVDLLAFEDDSQKQLKVVPIFGFGGVGKTTLARTLYHKYGGKFQCRAFVGVSRNPDTRRLLTSILSQIKAPRARGFSGVHGLIDSIREHLQGKRYLIMVDDLWTASAWDIISRAFPDGDCCSRIITTTQIEDAALACCGYQSEHILKLRPLNDEQSRKLFFSIIFGSEGVFPSDLEEVSYGIIRKCGGLPLATVSIASLLAREPNLKQWKNIQDSLSSTSMTNPTTEGMKDVLNLIYNNLPPHLKTCLLHLSTYPEGYAIRKDELVKQWVAERFIGVVKGQDTDQIARSYFDELVSRAMIQPVNTNYNDEVLSCTVHHMVLDLIRFKSMEENFITIVDYLQSTPGLPDKVRRLSVQFGGAKRADIPESFRISQVRSLLFCGFFKCVPSILDYGLLRVLILHIWADEDKIFDLSRMGELFLLRYLKIECNMTVKFPAKIRRLQQLETLHVDARLSVVPSDIDLLQSLLHLRLPSESNLPHGVGRMTSLRTLGYFDLGSNSEDNVMDLLKLTNLQDLQLTCSTVQQSENLGKSMQLLGSILEKLSTLQSVTLVPAAGSSHVNTLQDDAGASSISISCDGLSSVSSAPALLERLELLPRICIFPSIPKWFEELTKLCILKIAVTELSREDIDILKGLPALTALSLYIQTASVGRTIVFDNDGFKVLKYFEFACTTPRIAFLEGAMLSVQKLMLSFKADRIERYSLVDLGLQHLTGLKEFTAKIWGAGADEFDRRSAESALNGVIGDHPSTPRIRVQFVDMNFDGEDDKSTVDSRYERKTDRFSTPVEHHTQSDDLATRPSLVSRLRATRAMGSLLCKLRPLQ